MNRVIAAAIATAVCLAAFIVIRVVSDDPEASYETVLVTVAKAASAADDGDSTDEFTVTYQGQEYRLHGSSAAEAPAPGTELEAYLSNGEIYADSAAIAAPSPITGLTRLALTTAMAASFCTFFFWMMDRKRKPRKA